MAHEAHEALPWVPRRAGDSRPSTLHSKLDTSWQLEEALRGAIGPISVYYDQSGPQSEKGKTLDIRYVPVHARTGAFHPTVILLLSEPVASDGK